MKAASQMIDVRALVRDEPESGRFRVHRASFHDAAVFAAERERIFLRKWLFVGLEAEIPAVGDYRTRMLAGHPVVLWRGVDGPRVFLNVCPHRGALICRDGGGSRRTLRCMYHGWTFGLDGELAGMPGRDAYAASVLDELRLVPVPSVASYRGFVFAGFSPELPPIVDALGSGREILDLIADQDPSGFDLLEPPQRYRVDANWKLGVENTLDLAHFQPVHATFIDFRRDAGFRGVGRGVARAHRGGALEVSLSGYYGRCGLSWEPSYGDAERTRIDAVRLELAARHQEERARRICDESRVAYVVPNLMVLDFVGVLLRVLEPLSPAQTEITAYALAPASEPQAARAIRRRELLSFAGPSGFSTPDDIEAQRAVQCGTASVHLGHPSAATWNDLSCGFSSPSDDPSIPEDDGLLRAFWRAWRDALA